MLPCLIKRFIIHLLSVLVENSQCPQYPLSGRYCYLTSRAASLKEAVTYCRNHGGWLMAEPSGDVLANLPENYTWNTMWLAGTRLKWIWNNNSKWRCSRLLHTSSLLTIAYYLSLKPSLLYWFYVWKDIVLKYFVYNGTKYDKLL